jgi:hypothetical protein
MNKYVKIFSIIAILLAVSITVEYLADQTAPSPPSPFDYRQSSYTEMMASYYADLELYYTVKTILSTINATILLFLLATYVDMYKKLQSEFTIGLIIFSLVLLLYALTSNPLVQWLFGFRAFGLGPFAMLPDLFTTLALAVLLYLTMK